MYIISFGDQIVTCSNLHLTNNIHPSVLFRSSTLKVVQSDLDTTQSRGSKPLDRVVTKARIREIVLYYSPITFPPAFAKSISSSVHFWTTMCLKGLPCDLCPLRETLVTIVTPFHFTNVSIDEKSYTITRIIPNALTKRLIITYFHQVNSSTNVHKFAFVSQNSSLTHCMYQMLYTDLLAISDLNFCLRSHWFEDSCNLLDVTEPKSCLNEAQGSDWVFWVTVLIRNIIQACCHYYL